MNIINSHVIDLLKGELAFVIGEALQMAEHLDHIVLFSGDGDFRRLVEAVQRKGVRVTVISTIKSNPPMIADELRRQADAFVELTSLQEKVARPIQPSTRIDQDGGDLYEDDYPGEE